MALHRRRPQSPSSRGKANDIRSEQTRSAEAHARLRRYVWRVLCTHLRNSRSVREREERRRLSRGKVTSSSLDVDDEQEGLYDDAADWERRGATATAMTITQRKRALPDEIQGACSPLLAFSED